ncbi:MAG TPA: hypothetical protein VGQ28_02275 [Thermoanaerobaculia bacterium]|nr:hypothetical protein [Thermoanaerobaculia bacterium]
MPSSKDANTSTPAVPPVLSPQPNAFSSTFLRRIDGRDEPPTAAEADVAGPWRVERLPEGAGFGLFRAGERPAPGFRPAAVFEEAWMARLAAAVLAGTGRPPAFHLDKRMEGGAHLIRRQDGEVAGRLALFDVAVVDALNVAVTFLQSPEALASLLEAAGSLALKRCGAILGRRLAEDEDLAGDWLAEEGEDL